MCFRAWTLVTAIHLALHGNFAPFFLPRREPKFILIVPCHFTITFRLLSNIKAYFLRPKYPRGLANGSLCPGLSFTLHCVCNKVEKYLLIRLPHFQCAFNWYTHSQAKTNAMPSHFSILPLAPKTCGFFSAGFSMPCTQRIRHRTR